MAIQRTGLLAGVLIVFVFSSSLCKSSTCRLSKAGVGIGVMMGTRTTKRRRRMRIPPMMVTKKMNEDDYDGNRNQSDSDTIKTTPRQ
mmetsp:Transcript_37176/g.37642  ORF Transcript_37176/g.37642 Transcript_37176/m.37642 type:complete len:87 (+) Transcript_37176:336-596(+)